MRIMTRVHMAGWTIAWVGLLLASGFVACDDDGDSSNGTSSTSSASTSGGGGGGTTGNGGAAGHAGGGGGDPDCTGWHSGDCEMAPPDNEDCSCSDCANTVLCDPNACQVDTTCHLSTEGCFCEDCALHPMCGDFCIDDEKGAKKGARHAIPPLCHRCHLPERAS